MRTGPAEYFRDLFPVVDLLKLQMFHGSTGNNHTVKLFIAHQFEVTVKCFHVLNGSILGSMALQFHETDLNLQGRIGEQTDQVGLRGYFNGHQIQHDNLQRTDILSAGP